MMYPYFTITAIDAITHLSISVPLGINSKYTKAIQVLHSHGFPIAFVDNPFKEYRHDRHVEAVRLLRPRHATLRDYLTRDDCERLGIPYYSFDTLLQHADDIRSFAQHIIFIPKTRDIISHIPHDFVIGFTFPSSYAGVGLSFDTLRTIHRPIHLLGGSTWLQYAVYLLYPEYILSLDNNHISRIASFGKFLTFRRDPIDPRWITRHRLHYIQRQCAPLTTDTDTLQRLAATYTLVRWHIQEHRGCPNYWTALQHSLDTFATIYRDETIHFMQSQLS